ncbi:MAG: LD-carboxypeptidase [Reichenbachiella sp.]
MDRRKFVLTSGLLASATMLPNGALEAQIPNDLPKIKPVKLNKGDTIGLITPASFLNDEALVKAKKNIEALGFKIKLSFNFNAKNGFIAGTDEQRLDDLHEMFEDPEVDGIVCARGGYGTGRILKEINYNLIKDNPKVFVGFSDITALLYAIHKNTGLVCFHGPVGASEYSSFTTRTFQQILLKAKDSWTIKRPKNWKKKTSRSYEFSTLSSGISEGQMVGGNLSLMCSLLGTPFDIDYDDKIVFIEEIGEKPYRVDRMITQLLNAEKFDNCAGIALGVFNDCDSRPGDRTSLMLNEVLENRLGALNIPIAYGLPIGHIDDNATIPIGTTVRFNADEGELLLLEAGVR